MLITFHFVWETGGLPVDGVMAEGLFRHRLSLIFDLKKKRLEEEELERKYKERSQVLENLQQRTDELHEEVKKARELHLSVHTFLKEKDADQAVEKSEREVKRMLELEAELERLHLEYTELMERKLEQQRQLQRHSLYWDFLVQVVRNAKFDDVQALTDHVEKLLHFKEHFHQRDNEAVEQVDQQKNALVTLEAQHRLLQLQKSTTLSQLQAEIERMHSEVLTWVSDTTLGDSMASELKPKQVLLKDSAAIFSVVPVLTQEKKWNEIQETAAKKTLLLGRIKMATLNLYGMTDDNIEGEEAVDIYDTAKQLDKIKMFMQDHQGIVKNPHTPSQRHDGGKKDKTNSKNHIATHCKNML